MLETGRRKRVRPFRWQKKARRTNTWADWDGTTIPLGRKRSHRSWAWFLCRKRGPWSAHPLKWLQHHKELWFPCEEPGYASDPWGFYRLPSQVCLRPNRKKFRKLSHAALLGWVDGYWHCNDLCIMCSLRISNRPRTDGTLQVNVNHLNERLTSWILSLFISQIGNSLTNFIKIYFQLN